MNVSLVVPCSSAPLHVLTRISPDGVYIDHVVIEHKWRIYVGDVNAIRRADAGLISSRLMRNAVEIQTGTI